MILRARRERIILKWSEARSIHQDKWLLFEAIGAYSKDGQRIVEEISVINTFDDGKDALAEYAEQHKKDKSREIYVYHTANENLQIAERKWIGVRAYGQIET